MNLQQESQTLICNPSTFIIYYDLKALMNWTVVQRYVERSILFKKQISSWC